MKNEVINKLLADRDITLTSLRQEILVILALSNKPMGAYDILNQLKKKRPNAQPPTVYRVLNFFLEVKLIHRIEAQNAYVCCSHASGQASHKAILLLCQTCGKGFEFEDKAIFESIAKFSKKNSIALDDTLIQMNGICQNCLANPAISADTVKRLKHV